MLLQNRGSFIYSRLQDAEPNLVLEFRVYKKEVFLE